ncbi:MAG TPA: GGDEF domain-containing protein, partial [Blastocatellia bacterium]|nr:GGDEF domain-containing protein [Blastocatellia bacterium]
EIESYGSDYIQLMESVAQPASDAVYNAISFEQAQRAAFTDPVTGLANLRAITTQYEHERARSERMGTSLSLLVIRVSDLSEAAGQNSSHVNQLIAEIGETIKSQIRETDLLARYSDTGFLALLPDSGQNAAVEVRSRIREALRNLVSSRRISISMGTAVSPQDGTRFDDLLQSAQIDCAASYDSLADLTPLEFGDLATIRPS